MSITVADLEASVVPPKIYGAPNLYLLFWLLRAYFWTVVR